MKKIHLLLLSLVAIFVLTPTSFADDFQAAQEQIKQGDLKSAMSSLKQAVDKNSGNKEYSQEFMLLRQMIATEQQLEREKNVSRWNAYAQRLRTYYEQKEANSLLLDLDRKIYAKTANTNNAAMLAESLIAAGKAEEASQLLGGLSDKSQNSLSKILLGLALQQDGKADEARKIASIYSTPQTKELLPTPVLLRLARLESSLGEKENAISSLTRLFEQTPPSGQAALRERCKAIGEFTNVRNDAAFETSLNTASKVSESACSGGSSCGTCPMRAKCQGQ